MATPSQRRPPSFAVHFLAGGLGGTIGAAILCPLEVVKTRMQSSLYRPSAEAAASSAAAARRGILPGIWYHIHNVGDMLRTIQQKEGIRALWKGLGPNLVGVVPARSVYFAVYSQGKHFYTGLNNHQETSAVHMLSAATAGAATAIVTNPIWLIKTRMQLQSEDPHLRALQKYKNSFHCGYMVLKEEGIPGLYRGLSASFLGLAESTFQFVMYEYFKKVALERQRANAIKQGLPTENLSLNDQHVCTSIPFIIPGLVHKSGWFTTFTTAAAAKLIAALATYPHEVIRTRIRQTPINGVQKYVGLWQTARLIYIEEGIGALYGGMAAHLLRVVPNAAILFFSYEMIVKFVTPYLVASESSSQSEKSPRRPA